MRIADSDAIALLTRENTDKSAKKFSVFRQTKRNFKRLKAEAIRWALSSQRSV
jgi:hypothetical protein